MSVKPVKPVKPVADKSSEENIEVVDQDIENIKAFFNDPKSRAESDKLRHCIKYVLAEIATDDEEAQAIEKARIASEKGPTFLEFLFGKSEDKK